MTEFELIDQIFRPLGAGREDVALGIGDDAALLQPHPGHLLVACVDTLVEGAHFPTSMRPADVGYRVAAVNLSDFAAMGACPQWALLALTLPTNDAGWIRAFAAGLACALLPANVALVGGDTTRGPLTASLQLLGGVPAGTALTRRGARVGDRVWVSGSPGEAAAGLRCFDLDAPDPAAQLLVERFVRPTPRLALGSALRGLASACIDVSDGLLADAGHLARHSGVALELTAARIPLSPALLQTVGESAALELAATGGDDYELCFTAPASADAALAALGAALECRLSCIGEVLVGSGVLLLDGAGRGITYGRTGYRHF